MEERGGGGFPGCFLFWVTLIPIRIPDFPIGLVDPDFRPGGIPGVLVCCAEQSGERLRSCTYFQEMFLFALVEIPPHHHQRKIALNNHE